MRFWGVSRSSPKYLWQTAAFGHDPANSFFQPTIREFHGMEYVGAQFHELAMAVPVTRIFMIFSAKLANAITMSQRT
jgi:hypothetical protein